MRVLSGLNSWRAAVFALPVILHAFFVQPVQASATFTTFEGYHPTGMNAADAVTGWGRYNSFIRTVDGTTTTFVVPGATFTQAMSINDTGTVAGRYQDPSMSEHGFVRASDGSITTFEGLAYAINNRGDIVGSNGPLAFVRTASGKITTFNVPGASETGALGINDKGMITGYFVDDTGSHGFVRTRDGIMTTFDGPGPTDETISVSINNKGSVTGWTYDGASYHAFVRAIDGTITSFNDSGKCPRGPTPTSINRFGRIAVVCLITDPPYAYPGMVSRKDGSLHEFQVPGSTQTEPCCINDTGVIAGDYWDKKTDTYRGFLRFP